MTICILLQLYGAMAVVHSDVPSNQAKISEGYSWLQSECKKEQDKEPKPKANSKDSK